MAQNISLSLSESNNGLPITVLTGNSPGTLLHQASSEKDFIWLWLASTSLFTVADQVNVMLVKGSSVLGYVEDSLIKVRPGRKLMVEAGTLITGANLYAYVHPSSTNLTYTIKATGYVHRRID